MTRIFLTLLIACVATCAHAQLYKCKRADGSSTFQDTPCPDGSSSSKIAAAASISAQSLNLTPDTLGHYHSTVSINNVTAPGLIDTGASVIGLSSDLANSMGITLTDGYVVPVHTANGTVNAYIKSMPMVKIGGIEIYNVEVSISPNTPTLIGMSALKKFKITEENGQMVLMKK